MKLSRAHLLKATDRTPVIRKSALTLHFTGSPTVHRPVKLQAMLSSMEVGGRACNRSASGLVLRARYISYHCNFSSSSIAPESERSRPMEEPSYTSPGSNRSREVPCPTRDEYIVEWLPLVRLIARSELRRLGGLPGLLAIDLDDLVQSGVLGLIAAIDHFNPALSPPKPYFAHRIRWAMLDFLRSFPYFKDGVAFTREDEELLSFQPVTCEEIKRVETRVDLERLIGELPDQQRQVILALMYGVAQHSIASKLKITAGRVSQIKNESFEALRRRLGHRKRRSHGTRPVPLAVSDTAAV